MTLWTSNNVMLRSATSILSKSHVRGISRIHPMVTQRGNIANPTCAHLPRVYAALIFIWSLAAAVTVMISLPRTGKMTIPVTSGDTPAAAMDALSVAETNSVWNVTRVVRIASMTRLVRSENWGVVSCAASGSAARTRTSMPARNTNFSGRVRTRYQSGDLTLSSVNMRRCVLSTKRSTNEKKNSKEKATEREILKGSAGDDIVG